MSGTLATAKIAETVRNASQTTTQLGDRPREHEVEGGTAALVEHRSEHPVERFPPDEERERLVLVRRPRREPE